MTRPTADFEADEDRLVREVGAPLMELRGGREACPDPMLLLAAEAGTPPPETAAAVSVHVSRCAWCQALRADMLDPELLRLDAPMSRRIRRRVLARIGKPAPLRHRLDWTRR